MLVTAIHRKLLRDLWRGRTQVLTISLVLAGAVGVVIALTGAHRALYASRAAYYEQTHFPDAFAHVGRAPEAVADELRAIPGVAEATTRLADPALVVVPDMPEPALARVLSLPGGSRPTFDGLVLRQGRVPEADRADECAVLDGFALAHGLAMGDALAVTFGGRQHRLRVVGTVLSPEYVFAMGEGGMMPDDRRFTAVFLGRDALAAGLGARGGFDDVTLQLAPDASGPEVIAAIDRVLARYGGQGARLRADQPSNQMIDDELEQLRGMATRIPALFLIVAVFLIHTVLGRLVATQREQIAALRALGYTRGAIARHFLAYATAIAVVGSGFGIVLGVVVGRWFCGVYADFFRFPVLAWSLDLDLALAGVATALGSSALGAIRAAQHASALAPAEAMRPPLPPRYRRGVLSRLGLMRVVSPMGRMVVRELERRPLRALWSILGLGLAMSMLIVGSFSRDTMDQLADIQFGRAFTADLSVGLIAPAPMDALASLRQLPGVEVVEPMRAAAVRIRAGHHVRELALTALPAHSSLRQILDRDGDPIELPPDGLMLGVVVAERLGVGVGDAVEITPYEGDRLPRQVTVTALSDEMIGRTAYMELHAWARVLGQAPSLSGASLTVDPDHMAQVLSRLATMPGVAAVSEKRTITEAFERTTASFTTQMTLVVVLFASIIAVGVIYNNGRIALGERARELATLRVLGFTGREVAGSLVGEMVVHLVISVPVGMWLGREFARLLMAAADPERYRMVAYVAPRTFALAALVVGAAAAVTAAVMARRVHHLDPVSALKAND